MKDNRTRSQRWSDNIAEFCGSWGFVFWFSLGIAVWVLLNTYLILFTQFDPYPFILLNLFLTVVSTMQSPIIMMSQNRQVERDREMVVDLHTKLDKIIESQNGSRQETKE
jgi:uncharacterized membrane protein